MDSPRYGNTPGRLLKLKAAIEKAERQGYDGPEGCRFITISDELAKVICELLEDAAKEIDPRLK